MSTSLGESAGYPVNAKPPDEVLKKLSFLPGAQHGDPDIPLTVDWLRQNVWPLVDSFEIPEDKVICGMQAIVFHLVLKSKDGDQTFKLIGKRVVPKELPSKASEKLWIDFLDSVRREVRFYSQIGPVDIFPKVFYSAGYLAPADKIMDSYYLLLMEDVSDFYEQSSSIDKTKANHLMEALAKFHALNWNKIDKSAERGSFWVLERRAPLLEVENAQSTWDTILDRFPEFKTVRENVDKLAHDLASKAKVLDDFIADNLITQIHGDCKGWNLFFKKDSGSSSSDLIATSEVLFIDMQWTGIGHPLQDVAYALTTTLEADLLESMSDFVDVYIEKLLKLGINLDKDSFKGQYDKVWLDYVRVILTGLWKRFSPESIEKYKTVVGPSMIARSIDHAKFIIGHAHDLLYDKKVI